MVDGLVVYPNPCKAMSATNCTGYDERDTHARELVLCPSLLFGEDIA